MTRTILPVLAFFAAAFHPRAASAAIWRIEPDGMGDAPTIQAGIDPASKGDTILLAAGVFTGGGNHSVNFQGKDVIVTSESGAAATIVDCQGFGNSGDDWVDCLAGQENANSNFSADPLFCGAPTGDFSIQTNSPCAPPGVTGCGLVGALPLGCGPVSNAPATWASVKAMYRN